MKRRLRSLRSERGLTLVELLVSATMGVVVMGAVAMLVISAVRDQPRISQQAQAISTARWVLERLTREIRNGVSVDPARAKPNEISFEAYVRHSPCGGATPLSSEKGAIRCQVTYTCTTTACSRSESEPETYVGTPTRIFSGIDSSQVFTYVPNAAEATYVKVTLQIPNPSGTGSLKVSDGASLRNATLGL